MGSTTLARKVANLLHRDGTCRAVLWAEVPQPLDPLRLVLG